MHSLSTKPVPSLPQVDECCESMRNKIMCTEGKMRKIHECFKNLVPVFQEKKSSLQ
jgi:hypothetical protein